MKKDLLRQIKAQRNVTNVVVLTHNLDFVFLQNLLLPTLRRCGSPSLTVFADAHSATETFTLQAPLLSNLGRRYRVVPVAMSPGFCFHPKAVLLSGREQALLLVGSGNLTFGGWRDNAEIWAAYDSTEGTSEIAAFRRYLLDLVASLALNHNLRTEIDEAFDPETRPWAGNLDVPAGLIGRLGMGEPLLDRMRREIGAEDVGRLLVSTPYFDEDGEALEKLVAALGTPETRAVVDAENTNLPPEVASNPPAGVRFRPGKVPGSSPAADRRQRFLHAKLYAVERGDDVTLLLGSANCSRAALTLGGKNGNAELMAVRRLSVEELLLALLRVLLLGTKLLGPVDRFFVWRRRSSGFVRRSVLAARLILESVSKPLKQNRLEGDSSVCMTVGCELSAEMQIEISSEQVFLGEGRALRLVRAVGVLPVVGRSSPRRHVFEIFAEHHQDISPVTDVPIALPGFAAGCGAQGAAIGAGGEVSLVVDPQRRSVEIFAVETSPEPCRAGIVAGRTLASARLGELQWAADAVDERGNRPPLCWSGESDLQ